MTVTQIIIFRTDPETGRSTYRRLKRTSRPLRKSKIRIACSLTLPKIFRQISRFSPTRRGCFRILRIQENREGPEWEENGNGKEKQNSDIYEIVIV